MANVGFLVNASELPPDDNVLPLEKARIQYVVRTINECGIIRHALSDPESHLYLGPAMDTLPNQWDAERSYTSALVNLVLSKSTSMDFEPMIVLEDEDEQRIEQFREFTTCYGIRMKRRGRRKLSKLARAESFTVPKTRAFLAHSTRARQYRLLQAERHELPSTLEM